MRRVRAASCWSRRTRRSRRLAVSGGGCGCGCGRRDGMNRLSPNDGRHSPLTLPTDGTAASGYWRIPEAKQHHDGGDLVAAEGRIAKRPAILSIEHFSVVLFWSDSSRGSAHASGNGAIVVHPRRVPPIRHGSQLQTRYKRLNHQFVRS